MQNEVSVTSPFSPTLSSPWEAEQSDASKTFNNPSLDLMYSPHEPQHHQEYLPSDLDTDLTTLDFQSYNDFSSSAPEEDPYLSSSSTASSSSSSDSAPLHSQQPHHHHHHHHHPSHRPSHTNSSPPPPPAAAAAVPLSAPLFQQPGQPYPGYAHQPPPALPTQPFSAAYAQPAQQGFPGQPVVMLVFPNGPPTQSMNWLNSFLSFPPFSSATGATSPPPAPAPAPAPAPSFRRHPSSFAPHSNFQEKSYQSQLQNEYPSTPSTADQFSEISETDTPFYCDDDKWSSESPIVDPGKKSLRSELLQKRGKIKKPSRVPAESDDSFSDFQSDASSPRLPSSKKIKKRLRKILLAKGEKKAEAGKKNGENSPESIPCP